MVFIHNEEDVNFCKLNFIVRFKSKHYVIASVLETNYFNEHFDALYFSENCNNKTKLEISLKRSKVSGETFFQMIITKS